MRPKVGYTAPSMGLPVRAFEGEKGCHWKIKSSRISNLNLQSRGYSEKVNLPREIGWRGTGGVRAGLVNTHSVPQYWQNQPFSFQRLTNPIIIDPKRLKRMLLLADPADP